MFCQNCGKELSTGAAFCPHCGTKNEAVASAAPAPIQQPVQAVPQQPAPVQQPPVQPAVSVPPAMQPQPVYQQVCQQQGSAYYPAQAPAKKKSKAGLVLGIVFGIIAVLALIIIGSVCANNREVKKFYGEWEATMDLSDEIIDKMGENGKYLDDLKFNLEYKFIFNKEGTYKIVADEDSFNENMDAFKAALRKAIIASIRDASSAFSGYTDEQIITMFEKYYSTDFDSYVADAVSDMNYEAFSEEANSEGKYKVEKDKFYISAGLEYEVDENVYAVYEMKDDDTMVITDYISNGETDTGMFPLPLTLKKVG